MLFAAALTLALGPRNTRAAEARPLAVLPLPEDTAAPDALEVLAAHVAREEARHADLVPGTEKLTRFGPAGLRRAPWAVVYLHGFSASRQELSPLPEEVAAALGAHLFATRLAGHGRGSAAMAEGSVSAWKADALQALAIGRRLGERVLVIGNSTGAATAAWLAQQPEARDGTAWVLVSPNFGLTHPFAHVINWPWGRELARWVTGPEHRIEPRNEEHGRFWTTRYPIEALFALMAAVHLARTLPLQRWRSPVLMLLAPRDRVIDAGAARAAFARIGSPAKRLVEVTDAADTMQHVIAGRILSPNTTARAVHTIADWVATLPPAAL